MVKSHTGELDFEHLQLTPMDTAPMCIKLLKNNHGLSCERLSKLDILYRTCLFDIDLAVAKMSYPNPDPKDKYRKDHSSSVSLQCDHYCLEMQTSAHLAIHLCFCHAWIS
jgi:hypothetical protein